jgi:hypothetical protein
VKPDFINYDAQSAPGSLIYFTVLVVRGMFHPRPEDLSC